MKREIHNADCLEILPQLEENSIDAIVTDPPAGISFMNRKWDSDKGGRNHWIDWMSEVAAECLRVIKPGGHALVWALPRTSHWTATAWENAGWEPRDKISYATSRSRRFAEFLSTLTEEQTRLLAICMDESEVLHCFGSGFPKSLNVEKDIQKKLEEAIEEQGYEFTEWVDE